ncbi:MAG: ATP-binding cassette domain-containing protein, partial [Pygmaiobacter sp.]
MLELRNITFSAPADSTRTKEILSGVNLIAEDGKFMVITGPNGGGKSTLAKIIAGIEQPTSGSILFNGSDITSCSITERAQMGIAFAFQQPVRFKGLTVSDLVSLAAGKPLARGELCGYLTEVGLCARDYIDRDVNASLSGGEIKRIEIAMAMVRKAPLTIFDEPEAGIDLWSFNHLIEVFQKLRR